MSLAIYAAWVAGALLVLQSIVATHEAGHFMIARLLGIKVTKFAIGMGPKLLSRTHRDTEFSLRLLPIGGYVLLGPDDPEQRAAEDPSEVSVGSLFDDRIPVSERFAIALAGSLANFITAFFVFAALGFIYGSYSLTPTVGTVSGSAAAAGVQSGDIILEVDGQPVEDWTQARRVADNALLTEPSKKLTLEVDRNGSTQSFDISSTAEIYDLYSLGLQPQKVRYSVSASMDSAIAQTSDLMLLGLSMVKSFVRISPSEAVVGAVGPIELATVIATDDEQAAPVEADFDPVRAALQVFAFGSVLIGMLNLLPFPPFDGGRVAFSFIRMIRGRAARGLELALTATGLLLLFILTLAVWYHDIRQFIF